MIVKSEIYFVTSVYLNAWLMSRGFEVIKTAKLDNGKIALFFKNDNYLHEEIENFKNNYEIKEYITQLKNVQNLIGILKNN